MFTTGLFFKCKASKTKGNPGLPFFLQNVNFKTDQKGAKGYKDHENVK